jgi:tRNA(fMet)-specific endonuclease VapC
MLAGNEAVWKCRLENELHLIAVSIITVEEQINGWYGLLRRPTSPKGLAEIYEKMTRSLILLAGLPIVTFSEAAIYRFESLRTLRLNVGSNDLRIAAIALENNATVVTRNLRDFGRVPGLLIEDWSAE